MHWYTNPEWWLCVLGFPTLVFLGWQSLETQKAAKAAEKAADAALLNAKAVINSERAWVTVRPKFWSPELYPLWEEGDAMPDDSQGMMPFAHQFPAIIRNVGNTPAVIVRYAMKYVLLDKHPKTLSEEPDYGDFVCDRYFLIPKDKFGLSPMLQPPTLSKTQVAAVQGGRLFIFAYGVVIYEDVIAYETHETRFGYLYHFPQGLDINFEKPVFQQDGPTSYNHAS